MGLKNLFKGRCDKKGVVLEQETEAVVEVVQEAEEMAVAEETTGEVIDEEPEAEPAEEVKESKMIEALKLVLPLVKQMTG